MSDWNQKETWYKSGDKCRVEVVHWTSKKLELIGDKFVETGIKNHWNVYAYIYPWHILFDRFDLNGEMYQDACSALPLHGGPTFYKVHREKDEVTAVQIGCDYAHLYDDHYGRMENKDQAWSVFNDAEELLEHLKEIHALQSP